MLAWWRSITAKPASVADTSGVRRAELTYLHSMMSNYGVCEKRM